MTTREDYEPGLSPEALTAIGEMQKRMAEAPMGFNPPQQQFVGEARTDGRSGEFGR